MWNQICDYVIHQNDVKNNAICIEHGVHYNSYLFKFYVNSFEKKKAQTYILFMKNIFMPEIQKQLILNMYTIVSVYFTRIRRCIFNYWMCKKHPCNLVDLSFTPFSEYTPSQYFYLLDGRNKYVFTHTEMYNIIESSLTNADSHLIANPLSIKNPYTGTIFSRSKLYNIYFQLKHIPIFFRHFMNVDFDLTRFLLEKECILRQHTIHKKIRHFTQEEIKNELRYMIVEMFPFIMDLNITENIIYVECDLSISRELLTHYYNYTYSLNPYQRLCECKTLITKIKNVSNRIHKNIIT